MGVRWDLSALSCLREGLQLHTSLSLGLGQPLCQPPPPTSIPSSSPLTNLWLGHLGTHSLGLVPELLPGIWVIRGRSWARDTRGGRV